MAVERLTYAALAERLGVSSEAARALVKRHRFPRSLANDGKTLVAIDLAELQHKAVPARASRGHQPVTETVTALKALIAGLEAELAAERERSAGHRADFEQERDLANNMMAAHDLLVVELSNLCGLLDAAQRAARPVTTRAWREVTWATCHQWFAASVTARSWLEASCAKCWQWFEAALPAVRAARN